MTNPWITESNLMPIHRGHMPHFTRPCKKRGNAISELIRPETKVIAIEKRERRNLLTDGKGVKG